MYNLGKQRKLAENETERWREHETSGLGKVGRGVERGRGCGLAVAIHSSAYSVGSACETAMLLEVIRVLLVLRPCWMSGLKVKVLVTQSCPTLCDPMNCSPPGSSVHGILQARILEWVAIAFSRGSSRPRDGTRQILYHRSHQLLATKSRLTCG